MKKRNIKLNVIFAGIVICYVGYTIVSQQMIINRLNKDIEKYTEQNKKIEDTNAFLKDEIEFAKTNEYKEKLARERIGLIKPGEIVYIIEEGQ